MVSDAPTHVLDSGQSGGDSAGAKEKAGAVAGAAQQQVGQIAGTAKDQAAQVAGTAKEQVGQVAGAATEQARSLLAEAQNEAHTQASAQKDRAVSGLRQLSQDLSSMADSSSDGGVAGHVVSEAARRSTSLADYLDSREPGHLVEDLRELGRRRTGAFLLGAAVLGFAGGRLVKGARAGSDSGSTDSTGGYADAGTSGSSVGSVGAVGGAEIPAPPVAPPPVAGVTVPVDVAASPGDAFVPAVDAEPTTQTGRLGTLSQTPSLLPDDV